MSKKNVGFGARGWMLTLYTFLSFLVWVAVTNYPNNIMASAYEGMFGWNAALVATCYSAGSVISVIIQLFINKKIANGNVKKLMIFFSIATLVLGILLAVITAQPIFLLIYVLVRIFGDIWTLLGNGVIVGQWFPTRKGTVMGITTFAFPIGTGVMLTLFTNLFYSRGALAGFAPYLIIGIVAVLILIFALSNYPEEVGCFRDNDQSMSKEKAEEIMKSEMKARETSVWTVKNTLTSRDFWFLVIPEGGILFAAVGFMVQIVSLLSSIDPEFYATKGGMVMTMITVVACIGSWLLGVLDTKFGTKTSILIACIAMLVACILGMVGTLSTVIASAAFLAIFMGASSNYTVSGAASYWRREDFPSVFAIGSPVANLIAAPGPALIAIVAAAAGVSISFGMVAVISVVSIVCILLFNPKHLKEKDAKLRAQAGLPPAE